MKTKLLFFLPALLIALTAFVRYDTGHHSVSPPVVSLNNSFIFGAMNDEWNYGSGYSHADQIGINVSHRYTGEEEITFNGILRKVPIGRTSNDRLLSDVGDYEDEVTDYLKDLYDNHNGRRSITQRPKIVWLCYGQSSIYEAEPIPTTDNLWFYSFNEHNTGMDVTDNGKTVMYCEEGTDSPGYVVSRLKANTEQSKPSNGYEGDIKCEWYVKPRIRIDSTVAHNSGNTIVCKVIVLGESGLDTLKNVDIKASDFVNPSTGNYGGEYLEEFYFSPGTDLNIQGAWGSEWWFHARGTRANDNGLVNKADIKVEWLGNCDMWLDYVKVENDIAHDLLSNDPNNAQHQEYIQWIQDEVEQIAFDGNSGSVPLMMKFYMELSEFNNLPCMKYVNDKLKQYSSSYSSGAYSVDLMADYNYFNSVHVPFDKRGDVAEPEWVYENYVQKVGFTQFFAESYPMTSSYLHNPPASNCFSKIPNTLPYTGGTANDRVFGYPVSPDAYDTWLQDNLNRYPYENESNNGSPPLVVDEPPCGEIWDYQEAGHFGYTMRLGNEISKMGNIPFLLMPQAHLWYTTGEVRREPTNEEIDLMSNLAVSYGAKGLMYFIFESFPDVTGNCPELRDGILGTNGSLIPENAYQQTKAKWEQIKDISERMKKWEPYIMSFDDANRHSYIYHLEDERNALHTSSYFQEIITYKPGTYEPPCTDYYPTEAPQEYTYECAEDRYLQTATFNNPAEPSYNKYFMIVNRRCSPYYQGGDNGGHRKVKVKFDAADLPEAVNWKLVDLDTGAPIVFSKNGGLVDLGPYEPGEGKLYKMMPVATDGGTLVDNEVIDGNITIKDTIFTDGFNLTIEEGSNVSFDTNGMIIAEGGNFICGSVSGSGVNLKGGSSDWKGIKLNGCDTVKIYKTNIEDIKDSSYAIDMYNCKQIELKHNTFDLDNSGAVRGSYVFSLGYFTPAIVLYDNSVDIGANTMPVLSFNANSASSFPVIIDNCVLTAPSSSSSSAISITNITGGVIKNNEITGYNTSVLALSSSMDFYNNTMISSTTDCILSGSSGSTLGLRPSAGKFTGGENFFSASHEDANNVEIYNGYFYAHDGYNTFDIGNNYDDGKHFTGYFTESEFSPSHDYNCFTEDGSPISPVYDVTWGLNGDPISFIYNYDCNTGEGAGYSSKAEDNYVVYPITEGYNDTIKMRNGSHTLTASDSMFIEMRKRNYETVIALAENILENSPDIPEATDAVSKLYLATLRLDSAGSRISPLKTFLEQVILDNGENAGLVNRAFYFIQKCKAALGDYSSAMAGFEDIMNNNPNTYEALVASWDYSATALLMNGNGQGGGLPSPIINYQSSMFNEKDQEELYSFKSFCDDPDDRNGFSKEEKKQIRTNVIKTFEETRKEEINIINKLKERSDRGDRNAGKELKRRELMQNVIKKRQPNNIYEHINSVGSDIKTIFNATGDNALKNEQNTIPSEYELSQNFPNPFNPVTKIQFALPKDGKVQLLIYDILGREVVKLVNNEFRTAGRYVSEFNGSRLASGVYFYRISVDDGKVFDMVKKMVLVK